MHSEGVGCYWQTVNKQKYNLSDKIKGVVSVLLYGCTTLTLTKCLEKKLNGNDTKIAECCFEQILEATLRKTVAVWPLATHLTNHPRKTNKARWALLDK